VGDTADGLPLIVTEYPQGDMLEDILAGLPNGLDEDMFWPLFRQLGSALKSMHAASALHRNLGPENVVIDTAADGSLKATLVHLGVNQYREPQTFEDASSCLAPEQAMGTSVPASDIYALGALLWWALTGREYFDVMPPTRPSGAPTRRPDPRALRPDIPVGVARLVGEMLSRNTEDRPSAAEFVEAWTEMDPTSPEAEPTRPRIRLLSDSPPQSVPPQPASAPTEPTPNAPGSRRQPASARTLRRQYGGMLGLETMSSGAPRNVILDDTRPPVPRQPTVIVQPASAPPLQQPPVDRTVIDSVSAEDPHLVADTIQLFIGQFPEWHATLAAAVERNDTEAAYSAAGQVEDSVALLGAKVLGQQASIVRTLAQAGQLAKARTIVDAMEHEYARVFRSLMEVLAQLQA
jgi:serine/threonine protein kinase